MAWILDSDRPIYLQLVERIQVQIVSGEYPPGAKLPSVRDLAAVAAVNPNTMQKAFAELESSGLILTQRLEPGARHSTFNATSSACLNWDIPRKRLRNSSAEMPQNNVGWGRQRM